VHETIKQIHIVHIQINMTYIDVVYTRNVRLDSITFVYAHLQNDALQNASTSTSAFNSFLKIITEISNKYCALCAVRDSPQSAKMYTLIG